MVVDGWRPTQPVLGVLLGGVIMRSAAECAEAARKYFQRANQEQDPVWKERFLRHAQNHQMLARVADKCAEKSRPKEGAKVINLISSLFIPKEQRCLHGSRLGRCKKCVEEEKQRELAKWEEQNRIDFEARELQRSEAERLSRSLIPNLDDLHRLSPQQFENAVAQLFVRLKYDVRQTPHTNDYGRDAILFKNGKKHVCQCKRYGKTNKVGRPELQQFSFGYY
jgi:restriction endonuclease Mrr